MDGDFSLTEKAGVPEEVPLLQPPILQKPDSKQAPIETKAVEVKQQKLSLVPPALAEVKPKLEEPKSAEPPKKKRGRPFKNKTPEVQPELEPEPKVGRQPLWHPTETDYIKIRQLAELGWPSQKIVQCLEISHQQFAGAMVRDPRVKQEYDSGVELAKNLPDERMTWRPKPEDLPQVTKWASEGHGPIEIAAKLKVSRAAFQNRMNDCLQLKEAFEMGEGEFRAGLIEDSQTLLTTRSEDLKYVSSMLIFKLKAHCGLNDKVDQKPIATIEGTITHKHELKIPKVVPTKDIAAFAAEEMARAKAINATKLTLPDVIEAEYTNA